MIQFLYRLKLVLSNVWADLISSPSYILFASVGLLASSIVLFAGVYYFQFKWHQVAITEFQKKNIIGLTTPLNAFLFSGGLQERLTVEAKNDLRLQSFAGSIINNSWTNFSEDKSLERQFPAQKESQEEFRQTFRRGLTPKEMVEDIFQKYGLLKIKLNFKDDNNFSFYLKCFVVAEYFSESFVTVQNKVANNTMSGPEADLWNAMEMRIPTLHPLIFTSNNEIQLWQLSESLKTHASEIAKSVSDTEKAKSIFYGEILKQLASSYSGSITWDFSSLPATPRASDFLYMATMVATNNLPSEVTPLTTDARAAIWMQMIFSYFNLALIFAAFVKLLKL